MKSTEIIYGAIFENLLLVVYRKKFLVCIFVCSTDALQHYRIPMAARSIQPVQLHEQKFRYGESASAEIYFKSIVNLIT